MLSKKDEELRKQCVDHWFENLMMLQLNNYLGHELTHQIYHKGSDCVFCLVYQYKKICLCCVKCPIYLKTYLKFCEKTPWIKINKMIMRSSPATYEELFEAFTEEIDFLLSL